MNLYRNFIKPLFDKIIAITFLTITSPITLVLILILAIEFKGKPFFLQPRIGYKNRVFKIFKFRKMTDERDEQGNLLPESQRLTKTGRFIRRSSLDEIPQFINVLIGQMSIIGPRPLLAEYYPYYSPRELRRHLVKPGVIGWAAVNGRVALEWDRRFEYDLEYVENLSLWFDLKVMLYSVKTVIDSFLNPIDDPLAVLPLLQEYRAYIRMPYEKDNLNEIEQLLKKGKKQYFTKNDIPLDQLLRPHYFNNPKHRPDLLLIDDYKNSYNSFFYVKVSDTEAYIVDYYIDSENTYLSEQQMLEKYKHLISKYLKDLGYSNIKLNFEL